MAQEWGRILYVSDSLSVSGPQSCVTNGGGSENKQMKEKLRCFLFVRWPVIYRYCTQRTHSKEAERAAPLTCLSLLGHTQHAIRQPTSFIVLPLHSRQHSSGAHGIDKICVWACLWHPCVHRKRATQTLDQLRWRTQQGLLIVFIVLCQHKQHKAKPLHHIKKSNPVF